MTQTILDPQNPSHRNFLGEWQDAADGYNKLNEWRDANPRPPRDEDTSDWLALLFEEQKRLGIYDLDRPSADYGKGVIRHMSRTGTFVMKVWRPERDIHDRIVLGPYLHQCPICDQLFATDNHREMFCSDGCKGVHNERRLEAKATRRRDLQAKRSESLANRRGVCLACGTEFDLKRITAKTCSETCRKRLQRRPDLADEHLVLLEVRSDLEKLIANERELSNAALNLRLAGFGTELTPEQEELRLKVDANLDKVRPVVREQQLRQQLNLIAANAPALGAWLMVQPSDVQEAACSWGGGKTVLGPELWERLQRGMGWD